MIHSPTTRKIPMKLRKILAGGSIVAALLFAFAAAAFPHTGTPSLVCILTPQPHDDAALHLSSYNSTPAATNFVTITLDGAVLFNHVEFADHFDWTAHPSPLTGHTLVVVVSAHDDPTGSNGWSFTRTLTIGACVAPSTTGATTSAPPATTIPPTTSPGSTTPSTTLPTTSLPPTTLPATTAPLRSTVPVTTSPATTVSPSSTVPASSTVSPPTTGAAPTTVVTSAPSSTPSSTTSNGCHKTVNGVSTLISCSMTPDTTVAPPPPLPPQLPETGATETLWYLFAVGVSAIAIGLAVKASVKR